MKFLIAGALLLFPWTAGGEEGSVRSRALTNCVIDESWDRPFPLVANRIVSFRAAAGSTTTCRLTCDAGHTTSLLLKYGARATDVDYDVGFKDFDSCNREITLTSNADECELGWQLKALYFEKLRLRCDSSEPCHTNTCSDPDRWCFSGTDTVMTRDHGAVAMKDLDVGEYVMVDSKKGRPLYEPIYSFGHVHESTEATFLRFYTSLTPVVPLEISGGHLIYKLEDGKETAVRADAIEAGDTLVNEAGVAVKVNKIDSVVKAGLYMPLTPSGSIVVNDLKASAYVSNTDWAPSVVKTASFFGFTEQRLFHWWLAPHRFLCMGLSHRLCGRPDSTFESEEGILDFLLKGKRLAQLAERMGVIAQVFVFGPPLFVIFAFFNLLEYPLGPSMSPFVLAVLVFFLARFLKIKDKKWFQKLTKITIKKTE